nr:MAG TPA: hypothetical protein [Caudoviricetes sp.]
MPRNFCSIAFGVRFDSNNFNLFSCFARCCFSHKKFLLSKLYILEDTGK